MTGFIRTRLVGLAVLALLSMVALSACGGEAAPAAKSNADLLKEAVANMKAAKTYHMSADITESGQQVKLNGDVDLAANNMKLSMSAGGQTFDVVKVGSDYYSSMDGGKTFTKADAAAVPDLSSFTAMWENIKPEDVDKAKDALKDGDPATETIDGTATKHMTGNNKDLSALSAGAAGTQDGTLDIWVSTDAKPTIRQMKIASSQTNGTLKWTNIDAPVNITAPQTGLQPDTLTASR